MPSPTASPTTPLLPGPKTPAKRAKPPHHRAASSQYSQRSYRHYYPSPPDPLDPATPAPFAPDSEDEQPVVIQIHEQQYNMVVEAGCPLGVFADIYVALMSIMVVLMLVGLSAIFIYFIKKITKA